MRVLLCSAAVWYPLATRTVGPALAIVELSSIARGYFVLDAMDKRAAVRVLHADPITPGRFFIALTGGEAELEEAVDAGVEAAGDSRIDHTFLAYAHPSLLAAVAEGARRRPPDGSVGVLELNALAATVRAADAALKCAEVTLVDLHLARGIGGRGVVVLTGDLADVEAALEAGAEAAGAGRLIGRELIANPEGALVRAAAQGVRRPGW